MQVYLSQHHTPAWNLAAEEWLFHSGQDALFLYVNQASVILGCNQAAAREVDLDYCKAHQISVCRRISGGGAVYHDLGNLNFCFLGPRNARSLSQDFLQPIVDILKSLGVQAEIGRRKDLWIGGRKITGTASHFAHQRSLQHGTLLYDSCLDHLHGALGLVALPDGSVRLSEKKQAMTLRGVHSQPSPVVNLRSFLAEPLDSKAFFDNFASRSCEYFQASPKHFSPQEEADISLLAEQKYLQESWIFRK